MNHVRSSLVGQAPRKANFEPPKTQAEFDRLGYTERAQLLDEFPQLYKKFTQKEGQK